MKKLTSFILAMLLVAVVGCNTVKGIGKDIERGGEAIQRSATK